MAGPFPEHGEVSDKGPPKPLWRVLLASAVRIYVAVAVVLWAAQEYLIFPGLWAYAAADGWVEERAAVNAKLGARDVWLDDVLVWHKPAEGTRAVVYLHGNGELVHFNTPLARMVGLDGWDFVAMAYPGFADAPGFPTEERLEASLRRTLDWVHAELGVPRDRIVIHARSLGGGVAGLVADDVEVGGWVFESTFDSVTNMASSRYPVLPVGLLLRTPMDTASRVGALTAPILQIHSRADAVVPFARGEALAAALPDHAEFFVLDDYQHNQPVVTMVAELQSRYRGFLREVSE
jgi:fermentation-respiration switch protein FrsA (DUF1100 family)